MFEVGQFVKHSDHKQKVKILEIENEMIAFLVYPTLGGCYRCWSNKARFEGKLW